MRYLVLALSLFLGSCMLTPLYGYPRPTACTQVDPRIRHYRHLCYSGHTSYCSVVRWYRYNCM
jgi:hypothetical protein